MTEQDWMNATDPRQMLEGLRRWITARKLRLFGTACCRHIGHLLPDDRSGKVVELSEAVADDREMWPSFQDALIQARKAVEAVYGPMTGTRAEWETLLVDERGASIVVFFLAWRMKQETFRDTATIIRYTTGRLSSEGRQLCHADLLRDLSGPLPFRQIRLDSGWLTWNDCTVVKLAQAVYDQRELPSGLLDSTRLAVLADALEEAGCADPDMLAHLRGPGSHVRGCWPVELLLAKK